MSQGLLRLGVDCNVGHHLCILYILNVFGCDSQTVVRWNVKGCHSLPTETVLWTKTQQSLTAPKFIKILLVWLVLQTPSTTIRNAAWSKDSGWSMDSGSILWGKKIRVKSTTWNGWDFNKSENLFAAAVDSFMGTIGSAKQTCRYMIT